MAITLAEARQHVRQFARNAGDSSIYSDSDIDRAILTTCDDFVWYTRCLRATFTLVTVASTASVVGTTAPTGFLPQRINRVWIADEGELSIIDHKSLLKMREDSNATGVPKYIAYLTTAQTDSPEVYPTPDAVYTIKFDYLAPSTSFTPGASSATFNLPDDVMRMVISYGVPATLQHAEPEHGYSSESYKKYISFREMIKGTGGYGAKSTAREMAVF